MYFDDSAAPTANWETPASDVNDARMTFGKYSGKMVSEVPINYIVWLMVGKNTDQTSRECRVQRIGNYTYVKDNFPTVFRVLKHKLIKYINDL